MLKVEQVDPRGENVAEKMTAQIERGGVQGWSLVQILPLFDVILLVWDQPDQEQRG